MNDSMEYARLIGVPITSCEYEQAKAKKSFFKKRNLINKVNCDLNSESNPTDGDFTQKNHTVKKLKKDLAPESVKASAGDEQNELKLKDFDENTKTDKLNNIITAQIVAAFALVVAIILTNIFWENSGMNTLFKSVFNSQTEQKEDNRLYSDFSLNLPVKSQGVTLVKGVLSVSGEYALYPVCDGTVEKIGKAADGSFTVTIKHSDSFSSVIEGADYVYFSEGDAVKNNLPVCHTSTKASIYLYENGNLLTDYATVENSIVFNK